MGNLIISSDLTEPPSEVICFRDITLAASDYFDDILVECNGIEKDFVWNWLKKYGAMDFVSDFVIPYQEIGYSIRLNPSPDTNILIEERLWQSNVEAVIRQIIR